MKFKSVFPAIFGTVVEYYDYALYGFTAEIIAHHFFPSNDPTVSLLKVYGVFIAGSCSKPLGSILFGYLGDKYGRSLALKVSMLGIAFPTMLVGLMPGYAVLGWWAALLLLLCRILQGMFVAGESDAVRIFIYETLSKAKPCFSNSISGMACMTGAYLAAQAAHLSIHPSLPDYAWRIPFLIGGLLGILVLCLRRFLKETPDFTQHLQEIKKKKQMKTTRSFTEVIRKNKWNIFVTAILYGMVGGGYHFYFVFFGKYLSHTLQIIEPTLAAGNTSHSILVYTLCAPLAGWAADRLGPLTALKYASFSLLLMISLHIIYIQQEQFPTWLWLATAVNLSFLHTPGFVVVFQRFSVGERFRCVSIGHATGSMLLSGTAPFLGLWIWQATHQAISPSLYFMMLTAIGYLVLELFDRKIKTLDPPVPAQAISLKN